MDFDDMMNPLNPLSPLSMLSDDNPRKVDRHFGEASLFDHPKGIAQVIFVLIGYAVVISILIASFGLLFWMI